MRGVAVARKHPAYIACRDSGVEWLGNVPSSWGVVSLKRAASAERPITYGIVQCGPNVSPSGIPYIRPVDMQDERGVVVGDLQHTTPEIAGPYARASLRPGDIVVSIGPSFGKVMVVPFELMGANLTQGTARVAAAEGVEGRFLFWVLRSPHAWAHWDSGCAGATFRALTLSLLGETPVPLPPLPEQRAIAAFLDRETAKIDTLVLKKERLLELLDEQRTALISRAVTKGLDPDVPMKDSGVEWLGAVPEGWEVVRLQYAARLESGHTPDKKVPEYWDGGDIPWVSLNDTGYLRDHDYIHETAHRITREGLAHSSARLLPPGTVVFSRDATIGRCGITVGQMTVSQHFIGWVCGSALVPEYLLRVLRSMVPELESLTTGATLRTIGMPAVKRLVIPLPPLSAQRQILAYLDRETARIDALKAKIQRAIDLLKEYRTALISAAVTGKIDVRGEVTDSTAPP